MIFRRLGNAIQHRPWMMVAGWLVLLVSLRWIAPPWDEITQDGDFEYLPAESPSVIGQRLLNETFPNRRSRSQLVAIVSRREGQPTRADLYISYELARRFHNLAGVASIGRIEQLERQLSRSGRSLTAEQLAAHWLSDDPDQPALNDYPRDSLEYELAEAILQAQKELDAAIELTRELFDFLDAQAAEAAAAETAASAADSLPSSSTTADAEGELSDRELARAFHNRAYLARLLGQAEEAERQQTIARSLCGDEPLDPNLLYPQAARELPISEVWTWRTEGFGRYLIDVRGRLAYARVLILHLRTEFLAVENMPLFDLAQEQIAAVNAWADQLSAEPVEVALSGSAAVGSDLLLASLESTRHTELFTVLLVTLILAVVYRSPLLILLPLITIGVSLTVSTHLLALLTQLQLVPGFNWFDFDLYKTTKIFIVVILFGAGTDYCLFLVARYREELEQGAPWGEALRTSLSQVGTALAASALTTIVGLGMMFFAEFGKLRNSGPAIAICLAITLAACLTLAPAMLRLSGRWAFWPSRLAWRDRQAGSRATASASATAAQDSWMVRRWLALAKFITRFPGTILLVSCLAILPLAGEGFRRLDHVTYDVFQGLDRNRPSRLGAELLREHFPVGESGPVVVLAQHPTRSFVGDDDEFDFNWLAEIDHLGQRLKKIPGVREVRSLAAPLGSSTDGKGGIVNTSIRTLPQIQAQYVTQQETWDHRVTRWEIVLEHDPFSLEATQLMNRIEEELAAIQALPDSPWKTVQFSYAGTTAAIRDLRQVTQRDTVRIEWLVVIAVYVVLLALLRKPLVCLYMIVTVLLSFFATVGITDMVFAWSEGPGYQGLDWKVPLFLFVILVAVGEDYNVYLATRIYEEQARWGLRKGLEQAVARTGGIISSCGIIMAGTFITMTSGTWGELLPLDIPFLSAWLDSSQGTLKGLVQMGFALSLGVLIDTFFVRPILLPAFITKLDRLTHREDPQRG